MEVNQLKVGHTYSAKRLKPYGMFFTVYNDMMIIWMNDTHVQYDSPTIIFGKHYPIVTIDKFLSLTKEDVTDIMPKGDWREYK